MRVQANGKVRRSEDEWRRILARFERSGLSEAAFCRREKLSKGSFSRWKRRVGTAEPQTPTFVEWPAPVPSVATAGRSAGEMELCLPGGVVLRWRP